MKITEIHPVSVKLLKQGHPWITADHFSLKFPTQHKILEIAPGQLQKSLGFFIHDPKHPHIKARFWSLENKSFNKLLIQRLEQAFDLRREMFNERENLFLVFGEADQVPGLFVQRLAKSILIQYECFFWEEHLTEIINFFVSKNLPVESYFTQKRIAFENRQAPSLSLGVPKAQELVKEADILFQVRFDQGHDIGLYTDMASIRKALLSYYQKASSCLNLFSYTGAFSLMGLKHNQNVVSVDSSAKVMDWLEQNISANNLDVQKHESLVKQAGPALKILDKQNRKFDLIICDPPTMFTENKKRYNVLDFYEKNFRDIVKLLSVQGKAVLFINTHKVTSDHFKSFIQEQTKKSAKKLKMEKELFMQKDCRTLKNFPEGNYLKALVLSF